MICWSCLRGMPDAAEFCPHCEAKAEQAPTAEEEAAVQQLMSSMSPGMINEVRDAFEKSTSGEEFVNRLIVGDCPKCGSSNTGDCENVAEIEAADVARCLDCDQFWCVYCGERLRAESPLDHDCPVLEELESDDGIWGGDE